MSQEKQKIQIQIDSISKALKNNEIKQKKTAGKKRT